jgi:hypothetical protein
MQSHLNKAKRVPARQSQAGNRKSGISALAGLWAGALSPATV